MSSLHQFITKDTVVVVFVFLLALRVQVESTATLKLRMVRFDNPAGKQANGDNCDPDLFSNADCDHFFTFALDRGNSDDNIEGFYFEHITGHFQDKNVIEFGDNMEGVSNPIVEAFSAWPSMGVKFKVVVTDADLKDDDHVDRLVQLLHLTPSQNASVANWTTVIMHGTRSSRHNTSLTLKYQLYCDADFYSTDCSVYCVANDTDDGGHYTCDPATGNITCRTGWENESTNCITLSNDCLNHTCLNGATCVDGIRSYTCRCLPGYTGVRCETDINECDSNPCQHNGTCEDRVNGFTCSCALGFTGEQCSDVDQSTLSPSTSEVISDNEESSLPTWLYIVIAIVCLCILVTVVLVVFLCIRKRKMITSKNSSQSAPPDAAAVATASYAAFTNDVYLHMCDEHQENGNGNNAVNVYDIIDEMPATSPAAATADDVDKLKDNHGGKLTTPMDNRDHSSRNVGNVYDTIDEAVPSQATTRSASQPETTEGGYITVKDNVYLEPRKVDYDNVPKSASSSSQPTSPPPSAPEPAVPAAAFRVDAESEYVPPSTTTTTNVPCDCELESKIKSNDVVAYANSPAELDTGEQSNG